MCFEKPCTTHTSIEQWLDGAGFKLVDSGLVGRNWFWNNGKQSQPVVGNYIHRAFSSVKYEGAGRSLGLQEGSREHDTVYLARLLLSLSVLEHGLITKRWWLKTVMTHYLSCCGKKPLVF